MNNEKPIQQEAKLIGAEGCYFTSIIKGAEHYAKKLNITIKPDVIRIYEKAVEVGYLLPDCFVNNPIGILCLAFGLDVSDIPKQKIAIFSKREKDYKACENEIDIGRWEAKRTCVTYTHFVEMNGDQVEYDPYGTSRTCQDGTLQSRRVFTINDIELISFLDSRL